MWCGVAALSMMLLAQDASVIRVPVRMVAVPTLVFSKEKRLIPGLKKADFRVLDNGIPQSVRLDTDYTPVSMVIAVQSSQDMRGSLSYITKVGNVVQALLVGATGRSAVIGYGGDIKVLKPFGSGEVAHAFRSISARGSKARAIDAGTLAIDLLKDRKRTDARVLLFIGQGTDRGSEAQWSALKEVAEHENIAVYALNSSAGFDGGGSPANPDLGWLMTALWRQDRPNPLAQVIAATGGTELHFHGQRELEDAIGTLGVELRSAYLLSYYPTSEDPGRHTISVEVSIPGAKTYARPGYFLSPN